MVRKWEDWWEHKMYARRDASDDDDVFIKLSGLPGGGTLCGYKYKSHIAVDSTFLLSALEVSSIYYTFWLSRESNLRLICPGRSQLQKKDLRVEVHMIH